MGANVGFTHGCNRQTNLPVILEVRGVIAFI